MTPHFEFVHYVCGCVSSSVLKPPPTFKMHIRPLQSSDVPYTADVQAAAMTDDSLFEWLYYRRREYYQTYRDHALRRHKVRLNAPGNVSFVAVTDEGDEEGSSGGRIVGFAAWVRIGDGPVARNWWKRNESWGPSTCSPQISIYQD